MSSDKVASKIGGSILVLLGFSPSKLFKKKNASKHKNSEAQTAVHIPVVQNNLVKNQPKKIECTLEKGFVTKFWENYNPKNMVENMLGNSVIWWVSNRIPKKPKSSNFENISYSFCLAPKERLHTNFKTRRCRRSRFSTTRWTFWGFWSQIWDQGQKFLLFLLVLF